MDNKKILQNIKNAKTILIKTIYSLKILYEI